MSKSTAANRKVLDRCDLQYGRAHNAYVFRDGQRHGKWCLYFLNKERGKRHRFLLKKPNGSIPDPTPAGLKDALELAVEKYVALRSKTDRGEEVNVLTLSEMVATFLEKEERRISSRPHEGITAARYRLIRTQCQHYLDYCCRPGGGGSGKQVHTLRRGHLDTYELWRQEQTDALDKQGRKLPRPGTINNELSTIGRMWREVALSKGFIDRGQLPDLPSARAKASKGESYRRSAFTAQEWVQLEKSARLYWSKGVSRFDKDGKPLGYHPITKGPNKGKDSNRPILRNTLFTVNKGTGTKQSPRARQQMEHRQMLYLAMRISMESGIRIGSLRQMRWSHVSANPTLSPEDQKVWCLIEVPAENTKTGRWYELSAPVVAHLDQLRKITQPKRNSDLLFTNRKTGKPFSERLWRDGLFEAMVEAGLAQWSEDDSNNLRKIDIYSGKTLSWYSFRHTFITLSLERGVPLATLCANCDTSMQYVEQHYFHYDAKRATEKLSAGRKRLRVAMSNEWMKDPLTQET